MSTVIETLPPAMFSSLKGLVARHPVAAFLVMAYIFGSSMFFAGYYFGLPQRLTASLAAFLGLALPALLVTAATSGQPGVRDLVGRCLRWRVGLGW